MSVQLQMQNKIIYIIVCQSKGLWLKQEGPVALSAHLSFVYSLHICICVPGDPGAGLFWSQGHNLNKLGSGPLVDAKI